MGDGYVWFVEMLWDGQWKCLIYTASFSRESARDKCDKEKKNDRRPYGQKIKYRVRKYMRAA